MTRECVTHHWACDCREAEFAAIKAERDALRARIEGAPILDGYQSAIIHMGGRAINVVSAELVGKRVSLVVLEDGK